MPEPDFEGARQYALTRLSRELAPEMRYHSLAHTRDEVAVAVERLAGMEGLPPADRLLLLTAAYFHDLGYVEHRESHEAAGIEIVRAVLPGFGYTPAQLDTIGAMLLATRLPQTPRTLAEAILADADLDVLGQEEYWTRSEDLRGEWATFGEHVTDQDWYRTQLNFLSAHRYFTASARRLRDAQKQANIERLMSLLANPAP